jgi:hypothetical protein
MCAGPGTTEYMHRMLRVHRLADRCPLHTHARRVAGVYDIEPAMHAVLQGGYLNAKQLQGIADTLEALLALRATALQAVNAGSSTTTTTTATTSDAGSKQGSGKGGSKGKGGSASSTHSAGMQLAQGPPYRYPALAALAQDSSSEEAKLLALLRRCIVVGA